MSSQVTVTGMNLEQDVAVTIQGDDAAMFETVSILPKDLVNQDDGYTFYVYYKPTARGNHSASLVINAGNGIDPVTLTLTGKAGLYYDVNEDGVVSITDVSSLIDILLTDGYLNYAGREATISDVTELIDYLLVM